MGRSIGVLATGHLWAGIVEDAVLGTVKMYPDPGEPQIDLKTIPAGEIITILRDQILGLAKEGPIESVGAGFPGMIRGGVILESCPEIPRPRSRSRARGLPGRLSGRGVCNPTQRSRAPTLSIGGAGFPGMIRGGVILESPNLGQ